MNDVEKISMEFWRDVISLFDSYKAKYEKEYESDEKVKDFFDLSEFMHDLDYARKDVEKYFSKDGK